MGQNAIIAVVTIMLALIIKAALETAFKPLFEGDQTWQAILGLPLAQLAIFYLLTLRFYLGALRFASTEPKRIDFLVRTFNFVFAFLVFCGFYVLALSVTLPEFFYLEIVLLHTIDAAWFGLLYFFSHVKYVPLDQLEAGEFPIEPIRKLMVLYFVFSAATIAFGVIAYPLFGVSLTDPNATKVHASYLVLLVFISGIDFWALSDYYFDFSTWAAKHAKK